jgi:hypothetical protein
MHAPQITTICLYALGVGLTWAKHGKPRDGTENVGTSILATAISVAILWWGGFWG